MSNENPRVLTTEGRKAVEYAKARDRHKCVLCDSKGEEVHHIDEDWRNNDLRNLITLCKPCHIATRSARTTEMLERAVNLVEYLRGRHNRSALLLLRTVSAYGFTNIEAITSKDELEKYLESCLVFQEYYEERRNRERTIERDVPNGIEQVELKLMVGIQHGNLRQ